MAFSDTLDINQMGDSGLGTLGWDGQWIKGRWFPFDKRGQVCFHKKIALEHHIAHRGHWSWD